jgi:arylsulfatase A-like enzyme
LRALVEGLERHGVLDRSLIIITADHGEEFLEHDYIEHGWTLYDEVIRVPLLFYAPAALRPARTRIGASHVDVVPTVLDLLGVDAPLEPTDGRRLFTRDADGLIPTNEGRAQIAELVLPKRQIVRAVVEGKWKYITTHRSVPPNRRGKHDGEAAAADPAVPWGPIVREEIYDLDRDPEERRNLIIGGDDPEAARVRDRLGDHLRDLRARTTSRQPTRLPAEAPDVPPEDRAHLEALGYLDVDESD